MGDAAPVTGVASFRRFYEDNFRQVVGLAIALSHDRWAAEDVAQEAFTRAYRDWRTVGSYDRPDAWVRRVAVNLAMSRGRKLVTEAKALVRLSNRPAPAAPPMPAEDAEFWAAVRALPERQAQAVALFYVEDLSVEQVAEVMGISGGAAKSHLHRARRALAQRLGLAEGDER